MKRKKKLIELILFSLVVIVFCEATIFVKHPKPDLLALLTMGKEFRASPGMLFRAAVDKGWDMSKVDIEGLKRKEALYYKHLTEHYYKSKSAEEAKKYASIYAVDWEHDEKPWKYMFTHSENRTRDNLAIFAGRLIGTGLIVLPLALFGFMSFIIIRLYRNKKKIKRMQHLARFQLPNKNIKL